MKPENQKLKPHKFWKLKKVIFTLVFSFYFYCFFQLPFNLRKKNDPQTYSYSALLIISPIKFIYFREVY